MPETPSYFTKTTSEVPIREKGIMFPENTVKQLIKYTLSKLLNLQIIRSEAFQVSRISHLTSKKNMSLA